MSNPVTALEANFDGLVGPTHNYAGLAAGNLAAAKNANKPSNPRAAAHEGLAKMRTLAALGLLQGLLPPQERPHLPTLRALGFGGREHEVLYRALREAPGLLAAVSSASSMWTANAATVSPGPDTADGRVHFTPANLASHLHRALEAQTTARLLRATFPEGPHFAHHAPLPATPELSDEGAANHTRFCREFGAGAIELFVYGREADPASESTEAATEAPNEPHKFPARQSRAASEAVARLHGLPAARTVYARQHPAAIDAGAFHNDVVAVGHRRLLLHHEQAFADVESLQADLDRAGGGRLQVQRVSIARGDLALDEAIASYLFNSQILSLPDGRQLLACARECQEHRRTWAVVQRLIDDPSVPLDAVQVFDLGQSMHNGGGPACLRLRVVLTPEQQAAVHAPSWITPERADALAAWIDRHYRDRLVLADLADPQLLDESRTALDRLTQLLELGSVYDFQR